MTSLADRTVAALRAQHDELSALVRDTPAEQLSAPSGASEWSVAQVLSHLGSGAEIALATYQAALTGKPLPGDGFNQSVWDRWNSRTPPELAAGFLRADEQLVAAVEAMTSEQRDTLQIDIGFLPAPLPFVSVLAMRLNEAAQHGWDVCVALDEDAAIAADTAAVLAEHFADGLGFLLGFTGKADELSEPAVVDIQGSGFSLHLEGRAKLTRAAQDSTATFIGPLESAIRLFGGRLTQKYTGDDVDVVGNVTLDDLRRVFPGY